MAKGATGKGAARKFKLGLHTYTLHLSGFGESWGFQTYGKTHAYERTMELEQLMKLSEELMLDVLHITPVDLDNDTSDAHLARVREMAAKYGLELELNVSFDAPSDPRVNMSVEEALHIGHKLDCRLVKFSLDVKRPRPVSHSCMCPEVMAQLCERCEQIQKNFPLMEQYGMKVAIENNCDTFADEIVWMVERLNHPLIGICCDTVNSLVLMEGVADCVRRMAPYTYCCHFCDNRIVVDPDGTHSYGTAIGQGDVDCAAIMKVLRENAPEELDTIILGIELPLSGYSIEVGRELEISCLKESVHYMRDVLGLGLRGR